MFDELNGSDDRQLLELFWRLESMFAVDGAKTLEAPDFAPGLRGHYNNNYQHITRQWTSMGNRKPGQHGCHWNELKAYSMSV